MDYSSSFFRECFPRFPASVVTDVLLHVPPEHISEALIRVPALRDIIVTHYYEADIHLILSPPLRPHACVASVERLKLIDIVTFSDIEDFLDENPDITPRKFTVIAGQDWGSLEILLQRYRSRLQAADSLDIQIEKHELTNKDLDFLVSFPNLKKLQTARVSLKSCADHMSSGFAQSDITELVFLGHELEDWLHVQFPAQLQQLDLSWFHNTHTPSVNLPQSLRHLYWNQAGVTHEQLQQIKLPHLHTLMLTFNHLSSIDLNLLPRTLQTIDLSHNCISHFEGQWPPYLRQILLANNFLKDETLAKLSDIPWPDTLHTVKLDQNDFTTLEHLKSLPQSVTYLDISNTQLRSFSVAPYKDGYRYYKFPDQLETLIALDCRLLSMAPLAYPPAIPLDSRIKFPKALQTLNLTGCNIDCLAYFVFPPTLRVLSLAGNRIRELTSYDVGDHGWIDMTSLVELELYFNSILTLEDWLPPKSLRTLDLSSNQLQKLTYPHTPLFNPEYAEYTSHIELINLERNRIHTIDSSICLPRHLLEFNLSHNNLLIFHFNSCIAEHAYLRKLDLGSNLIERLLANITPLKHHSNLKHLNLSKNTSPNFKMTTDEFYAFTTLLGLTPAKRKHNIRTKHEFL